MRYQFLLQVFSFIGSIFFAQEVNLLITVSMLDLDFKLKILNLIEVI